MYIVFRIKNALTNVRKLRQYVMPAALRRVINRGFKTFENMDPSDVQKLQEVRYVSHYIKKLVKC
jgi:hypothetical protein